MPQIVNDPYGPTSPFLVGEPDGDLRLAMTTARFADRTAGFEVWVTGDGVDAAVEGGFLTIVAVDAWWAPEPEEGEEGAEPALPEVTVTVNGVDVGPPSIESRPDEPGEQVEPKSKPVAAPAKPAPKPTKRGQ